MTHVHRMLFDFYWCWRTRIFELPVSIGHLCWVSAHKWIYLLKSAARTLMMPLAIFESRVSNFTWCFSNTNPEWSNSSMHAATSISASQSLINRGWLDPDITSRRKETFQETNLDACGPGSNSNLSAAFFLDEEPSSANDRVSDSSVEVDVICSHGLHSAGCDVCYGEINSFPTV